MLDSVEISKARQGLLEKYLRGDLPQKTTDEYVITHQSLESPAPLSFGQQQIWLLNQFMSSTPVYNECVTIHLPGPLNVPALEQSFNEILKRHEVWRTSFPFINGQPVQMVHAPLPLSFPVIDLRYLPPAERETEALRLATEDARLLFDLAEGPLLRAKLVQLDDEEHRLFLTLHHIIFDGVAMYQGFLPELRTLYETFCAGQPSPLPAPSIQYSDYARWQREWLQGEKLDAQLAFWKKQLAGAPTTLELPTDHPRPPVQTYRGSMLPFALSRQLTADLKALSRQEGVTLYMLLAAAFNTLLYRYTGQDDILIGTATAGRNHPEVQNMLGFFLNTIVLRTDLSGNPTFRELLGRVRETVITAVAHEDMPFEYLVKELQPERNLSQNPLFQVLLTLEPPLPILPSGWTLTQMDVTVGTSKFDLSLELDNRPEGLIGRFEYNSDLFDTLTIERMVGHWKTLLESIVADPAQPLSHLSILTEAERQQLLIEWNATRTAYPAVCIHRLFEEQVERTPDAVAVVYENQQLTYRELNARANQLAHHLRQPGVGAGLRVGLCVERSLEMVVGLLGILKAGGAYVPLDPTYPPERLAFMLSDAQVPVLVTQQRLLDQLPAHQAKIVCLDADTLILSQHSEANPVSDSDPTDLAYVIYTSGSTGRPKGVRIPHRAVVNFLLCMRHQPGLTSGDTLLAVTTLSFDIAALELFLPLIVGARLVVASRDVAINGEALAETLVRSGATVMQATPITWRILLASGWQGNRRLKVLCGGEALPLELARQLLPKVASLWNMYGPTETTIWSTTCGIGPGDESITIGRPIANTQIYLLDQHLQIVPIGVPGELHIGGDGLAAGYLHRPELTAERFIPNHFSNETGARLYKTGDLARYRPDGTIELIGRLDQQVKIRGFRIELGEIESLLNHHSHVRQAVVVVREDVPGDRRLVAYVLPEKEQAVTAYELQDHLTKQLPAYMIPSAFVFLEALPRTPNGKVDRHALPAPEISSHAGVDNFVAPTLKEHFQLVAIWEELLGVHPIGIRDNFFYLGGHSFLATRLIDQIEQVFGKRLSLTTLFAGPTIEQLTHALQQNSISSSLSEQEASRSRAPVITLQHGGSKQPFFFLHGNWDGGSFYCYTLAKDLGPDQPFYVLEPYRFDGLREPPAFEEMAAAHIETMRTVQPEGPYMLGGFCSGGLIAFDIARQLRAQGQAVDLLVLIEPGVAPFTLRLSRMLVQGFGKLIRFGPNKQLDWFLRLRHVYQFLRYKEMRHSPLAPSVEMLRQDGTGIYAWLAAAYYHRPYPGKVTFFWASEKRESRRAGWGNVNTDGEIHVIPGSHYGLLQEALPALSSHLKICVEKAQTADARTTPSTSSDFNVYRSGIFI